MPSKKRGTSKRQSRGGGGTPPPSGGVLQGFRTAMRRAAGVQRSGPSSQQPQTTGGKIWNIVTWLLVLGAVGFLVWRYMQ